MLYSEVESREKETWRMSKTLALDQPNKYAFLPEQLIYCSLQQKISAAPLLWYLLWYLKYTTRNMAVLTWNVYCFQTQENLTDESFDICLTFAHQQAPLEIDIRLYISSWCWLMNSIVLGSTSVMLHKHSHALRVWINMHPDLTISRSSLFQ